MQNPFTMPKKNHLIIAIVTLAIFLAVIFAIGYYNQPIPGL